MEIYDPNKAQKIAEVGKVLIKILLRKQKIEKILNGKKELHTRFK
jgi:hypothetical protein